MENLIGNLIRKILNFIAQITVIKTFKHTVFNFTV